MSSMSVCSLNIGKQAYFNHPKAAGAAHYAATCEENDKHQSNHR